jgi:cytochrome c-type biogenesis protein CcmH/NrfF
MTALALSLLWKLWPAILAVGGALLWGFRQRQAGAAKERAKREAADRMVEDIADQIQNDVRAMSPEQVDAELRKRSGK